MAATVASFEANLMKTAGTKLTQGYLKARRDLIESYWAKFTDTHSQIEIDATAQEKATALYFTADTYADTEASYLNCSTYINDKQTEMGAIPTAGMPANHHHGQPIIVQQSTVSSQLSLLPPTIPTFDGNYQHWPSFYDIFTSLVHNDGTMPAVHKLHHLRSSLTGEAEQLVRHFSLTASNYGPAWDIVKQRYSNGRVLLDIQLRILFNQPKAMQDDAESIQTLMDTTTECLYTLQNLEVATENWDPLVIYLMTQRLPPETLKLWQKSLTGNGKRPSYRQLVAFLEDRFRTLQAIANVEGNDVDVDKLNGATGCHEDRQPTAVTSTSETCIKCSGVDQDGEQPMGFFEQTLAFIGESFL